MSSKGFKRGWDFSASIKNKQYDPLRNMFFAGCISLGVILAGCREDLQKEILPVRSIDAVDSFTIGKVFSDKQELCELQLINDTLLLTNDGYNRIFVFIKNQDVFSYNKTKDFQPYSDNSRAAYYDTVNNLQYSFINNQIYVHSPSLDFKDSVINDYYMPYLNTEYRMRVALNTPVIQIGDTFILAYTCSHPKLFYEAYKEKNFVEFHLDKKYQIGGTKIYGNKPKDLLNSRSMLESYCFANNSIYSIYSRYDTIYEYDRSQQKENKIPIRNKDYIQPELLKDGDLNSDEKQRDLESYSFHYTNIFYNSKTEHFVIFYYPEIDRSIKRPYFKDKKLHAIVLDRNFEIIQYLNFPDTYLPFLTFINFKNQGVALPLYNEDPETKNTKYYIFSF